MEVGAIKVCKSIPNFKKDNKKKQTTSSIPFQEADLICKRVGIVPYLNVSQRLDDLAQLTVKVPHAHALTCLPGQPALTKMTGRWTSGCVWRVKAASCKGISIIFRFNTLTSTNKQ